MKKYLILVLLGVIGSVLFLQKTQFFKQPSKEATTPKKVGHSSHLFDPAFFSQAYEKGQQYKKIVNTHVFGGIIPHHLLAAPLIAGFFEGIEKQKISTVILLSPNHYGIGPYNITTSKGVWTTIFGNLDTDTSKISSLESDSSASISESIFNTEHGIYGITPFIKKTFPKAKIVPLAIKSGISKKDCDTLAQALSTIADSQTIILASSDFSHYLSSDQADMHDKESITAIRAFDVHKVFNLDHTNNTDSPESIYTLLKVMQLKKATKSILIENTNSAKLTKYLDIDSTTSYITMYFIN